MNIDDIIEVACRDRNVPVDRFTWISKFRDRSSSERQIIHLHGYARSNSDPDNSDPDLVFSVQEYVSTVRDPEGLARDFHRRIRRTPVHHTGSVIGG